MKDKRVLVTGGSGFIGSHLVKRLVQMGAEVHVLTRNRSVIDNIRLDDVWKSLKIVNADMRNFDSLGLLRRVEPEIIFHLAAYHHVGDSFTHFSEALDTNCLGTANLLEALENYERFVYTSTSEVYGFQLSVPFKEDMVPHPISPYSIGKYAGELYCLMKYRMGYPITVLRPFNVFGPYQSVEAVIPEIIGDCLQGRPIRATEGKQTREFNYVDDIIDGFILAAQTKAAVGEIINLGGGQETSIKDLILKIIRLSNSKSEALLGALPYRPTEIWRMFCDNHKAKDILNWSPKVGLDEGLRRTILWFQDHLNL
jgi:nucleoside-diphosphate-sugar epimerase